MGFRQGGSATVWEVVRSGDKFTKARVSTSRKNKQTDQYETDFSGFVSFVGAAHQKAGEFQDRTRIKILNCDVTNDYNKEEKREYTNYTIFDFELADGSGSAGDSKPAPTAPQKAKTQKKSTPKPPIDVDDEDESEELPF
ncbi:MAG: hypothetical protein PHR82_06965 [Endomicrobiaceae bacterium]|nr:hypothetical protein [Endomicrobiaceae bacterium]